MINMKPNDLIHLAAFMVALKKLDQPLPPDIQSQLNEIAKSLQADPNNIGNLDNIAEKYPPLDAQYQTELENIEQYTNHRGKNAPPEPLPTHPNQELTNAAINSFNFISNYRNINEEPEPLPTHPSQELTNAAIKSFSSANSVDEVKKVVDKTLLERVMAFILGQKANG